MTLTVQQELIKVWAAAGPAHGPAQAQLRGLVHASAGGRTAAIVVTDRPLDDAELGRLRTALAESLGRRTLELVALDAADVPALVRQWVHQAAQASGRGVRVRVEQATAGKAASAGRPTRVLVSAIDSSARELALRLASPQEPALPALRVLFDAPELIVLDADED